ncbi:TIGR02301 family protein [Sinorhizobium numidicum]|uniref:TIGR02301 family protein n=1 Tax=Sinorhizobium numidicum TaxID=680248 RepID=A0ABY8CYN7_9HYPH|nr:TIGR02301 family protein [Sinorhizobium numidicum]WEX78457.1 TIGR02301 family protein [Sinorhizobium numidicum]WEX81853.1 TIGR02301 family protein [Sinorhizobium numidicum]
MTSVTIMLRLFLTGTVLLVAAGAAAQKRPPAAEEKTQSPPPPAAEERPTPYDQRLIRLAEILGSVHYLRNLCLSQPEDNWRRATQELIDKETADEPQRRERMTAAFNRGYRTFASVYTTCTEPATLAERRYRAEGATLASEIVARFGN